MPLMIGLECELQCLRTADIAPFGPCGGDAQALASRHQTHGEPLPCRRRRHAHRGELRGPQPKAGGPLAGRERPTLYEKARDPVAVGGGGGADGGAAGVSISSSAALVRVMTTWLAAPRSGGRAHTRRTSGSAPMAN
eukprot:scaffold4228_cov135-Isochrysis_galbana.AAC.4